PAKRYGWGWGIPGSWQGWLVLAAFVGLLVLGSFLFPPSTMLGAYLAYVTVLCVLLIGMCWLKGERRAGGGATINTRKHRRTYRGQPRMAAFGAKRIARGPGLDGLGRE